MAGGDRRDRNEAARFERGEEASMSETYSVKIRAIVVKTVEVEASDEDEAIERAHEMFSVTCDGPEDYEQETVSVTNAGKQRQLI